MKTAVWQRKKERKDGGPTILPTPHI